MSLILLTMKEVKMQADQLYNSLKPGQYITIGSTGVKVLFHIESADEEQKTLGLRNVLNNETSIYKYHWAHEIKRIDLVETLLWENMKDFAVHRERELQLELFCDQVDFKKEFPEAKMVLAYFANNEIQYKAFKSYDDLFADKIYCTHTDKFDPKKSPFKIVDLPF